ncbi:10261_t:CDS:1 [Diversispora eburnea]|uniref:10261_t:CDS:1 n=1 Tax=Diversispora eburnea TaxID=1213867 RepID=A0A9N8YYW4_9GLOM|nr:10261_t:CDS:1 [Diversispora eburnea]
MFEPEAALRYSMNKQESITTSNIAKNTYEQKFKRESISKHSPVIKFEPVVKCEQLKPVVKCEQVESVIKGEPLKCESVKYEEFLFPPERMYQPHFTSLDKALLLSIMEIVEVIYFNKRAHRENLIPDKLPKHLRFSVKEIEEIICSNYFSTHYDFTSAQINEILNRANLFDFFTCELIKLELMLHFEQYYQTEVLQFQDYYVNKLMHMAYKGYDFKDSQNLKSSYYENMFDLLKSFEKLKKLVRNRKRRATMEKKKELKENAGKLQRYFPYKFPNFDIARI